MMCMKGPPWSPGKTVRLSALACFFLHRINPPRGPRSVLCVVVVTKSQYGTGLGVAPGRDETGDVCDVGHRHRAVDRGDLGDALEVDRSRIRRGPANDQLGPVLGRQPGHGVIVDRLRLAEHAVRIRCCSQDARQVQRVAVRQVAAVGQVHPENRVTGFKTREVDPLVGLAARVRLHVGGFSAEQLLGAGPREPFRDVDDLAASVITAAGVAFGVLVGHHGAHRLEHGFADEVLGSDQLQATVLSLRLGDPAPGLSRDRFRSAFGRAWRPLGLEWDRSL